ncbi:MAG: outer membrane protein transport protein [Muribaculaceae bacterium]|nr:outer membrane protein transport protein [Muribaculaceae bacterium]
MKRILFAAIVSAMPSVMLAQSAVDAYQLTQGDLKGTARFVSMGGAFGALGGDLSTLTQNPAGIGVYRSSEIGVTLDFNFQATKTNSDGYSLKEDQVKVYCPNFGYVGNARLKNDVMPMLNWGISYSRAVSFDRIYRGRFEQLNNSVSNYIASFSGDYSPSELGMTNTYNPYLDSNADWLSILAYNTYMINPSGNSSEYNGLFKNGTTGNSEYAVHERGYIDEFSLNFGGNFVDMVYWGIGLGITDIDYVNETFYDEELVDAQIVNYEETGTINGDAYIAIDNFKHVSGTGYNFKAGLIVKPINELRFGFAVHTPTYYDLRHDYDAISDFSYSSGVEGNDYTEVAIFDSKLRTPWKIMASAAGVIGGRAILSLDYEYNACNDMSVKTGYGYSNDAVNNDIKNYYQGQNIIRVGAEYRITPQFSLRAGYNYQSSNVNKPTLNGAEYVYTSGTDPSYTFDNTIQYITGGLGFRTGGFYIDAAYVYKNRESIFTAYSNLYAPVAKVEDNNSSVVMSVGYKF